MEDALQIGKAGEYLVCADLILKGYIAYPSEQGLPYDVVADIEGKLYKIQVKTTITAKYRDKGKTAGPPIYFFHVKRCGKGGKQKYGENVIDIFALVALDRKVIGYIKYNEIKQCTTFRSSQYRGEYYGERGVQLRNRVLELMDSGMSSDETAEVLNTDRNTINRYKIGALGTAPEGIYLDDLTIENAISGGNSSFVRETTQAQKERERVKRPRRTREEIDAARKQHPSLLTGA